MSATAAPAGQRVSVVIPVLNAGPYLKALLKALLAQRPEPPGEIILVDSNSADNTRDIAAAFPSVRVLPISDFSHGRARNMGAREAKGDIIALMTQDALPRDSIWLSALLEPFADPAVGAAYSRQTPRPDAPLTEIFFLGYHFPDGPAIRREKKGAEQLSFQTVFFSNVSAAIRRGLLLRFPFDENLIMSEDQQLARDLRPKVLEYVELLSEASKTELRLDRLPEDATTLALLVAIALQVDNEEKQALLEMSHVPEMLARERYLLSLETMLLRHMVQTQADVQEMGGGSTGYVFPN